MFIIGLTGGIGSGKTAVANCFRALGVKVVDADQGSREVVKPGMPALISIAEHFGSQVILADGNLNRQHMREIIFSNSSAKQWLEGLLHPLIREWLSRELLSATSPYAILESPLLFEMNQHRQVNRTLVVDVPVEVQISRASMRDNNNPEQIKAIITAQISRQNRLRLADDVIDNTCTMAELSDQVTALHARYLTMARC
jgi:dephospho-CoA kinase